MKSISNFFSYPIIALISILFTIVFPGFIAFGERTFYSFQIENKANDLISNSTEETAEAIRTSQENLEKYTLLINSTEDLLHNNDNFLHMEPNLNLISYYNEKLNHFKPLHYIGFFPSSQPIIWGIVICGLLSLLFRMRPLSLQDVSNKLIQDNYLDNLEKKIIKLKTYFCKEKHNGQRYDNTFVASLRLGEEEADSAICSIERLRKLLTDINDVKAKVKSFLINIGYIFVIYFIFQWINYVRNFVTRFDHRQIFAYNHHDIGPHSFLYMEFVVFMYCVILIIIWTSWIRQYKFSAILCNIHTKYVDSLFRRRFCIDFINKRYDSSLATDEKKMFTLSKACRDIVNIYTDEKSIESELVSRRFADWQVRSVALGMTYFALSYFSWQVSHQMQDGRYFYNAVATHATWGFTWLLISRPLINSLRFRSHWREQIMGVAASTDATKDEVEKVLTIINQIEPVSSARLAIASAVSAVSFLVPLANLLVK